MMILFFAVIVWFFIASLSMISLKRILFLGVPPFLGWEKRPIRVYALSSIAGLFWPITIICMIVWASSLEKNHE